MSILKIVKYPDKVLKCKAITLEDIDASLIKVLAKDMFDTMYLNDGVGLAANQIGISKQIAVMNPTGSKQDEIVLINPEITKKRGMSKMEEGCLSLPGISSEVKRANEVEVKFMDLEGNYKHLKLKGLPARIVQHELDHLNGFLFVDRLNFLKRKTLLKKFGKRGKA